VRPVSPPAVMFLLFIFIFFFILFWQVTWVSYLI
jgi:hypothetical protein